ncbi:cytidine and deoxycytidylate deaminase zincbinding region domain containing protein [Acanthamoeba castellanii str. Neff]|uniref:Cytidine and deoxycytidylate deaminase zincbinding region domain containing protein n=1 Tax=Acanthamoeba castellanii (strain ATCC 30010 / Neff) TaxID=1257118 RepID=L8GSQ1_ACACF|nr:cytidine and deoxycytidylate deaminase zincbinding region domain containing protein [Acanthamoeba castellanii str. Neff]ELR15603.1 cytidine and deoxycytidylate deaminase zincbinding region domain containing protein [Acanthamoeba castellanii str. Neff]
MEAPAAQGELLREFTKREKDFMLLALDEGRKALKEGEVPVGCVIVHRRRRADAGGGAGEDSRVDTGDDGNDDVVIATGYNKTNERRDATLHAEVVAIGKIMDQLRQSADQDPRPLRTRWTELFAESELFVTCEPCIMCAGALLHAGIGKVYFGCSNERFGGCGSVLRLHDQSFPGLAGYPCVSGLFVEEAIQLLKQFYLDGNPNAPNPKRPLATASSGEEEPSSVQPAPQ